MIDNHTMTLGKPPAEESGTFTSVVGEDGEPQEGARRRGPALHLQRVLLRQCRTWQAGRSVDAVQARVEDARDANRVHLTVSGCLGPCVALNAVLFVYRGQTVWFQSVNSESDVVQIYDYLETVLDQSRLELPTGPLAEKIFCRYVSDAVCSLGEDGAACAELRQGSLT